MGAKGKRRREKNYKAAHGGYSGLPPPPDPSKIDALPSKLRQIMSFTKSQQLHSGAAGLSKDVDKKHENDDGHALNGDTSGPWKASEHTDSDEEQHMQSSANDKKKKKRKRKEVKDLRYLESKKKKHKKVHEENLDFPGREKIKFGDIVQAPPKLAVIPKAFKNAQDASQERLRLRAIEEYRSRKGWTSRPGIHLPPPLSASNA